MVPCTWTGPVRDGRQSVGDGEVAVIVRVNSQRNERPRGQLARPPAATSSGKAPPLVSHKTIQAAPAAAAA